MSSWCCRRGRPSKSLVQLDELMFNQWVKLSSSISVEGQRARHTALRWTSAERLQKSAVSWWDLRTVGHNWFTLPRKVWKLKKENGNKLSLTTEMESDISHLAKENYIIRYEMNSISAQIVIPYSGDNISWNGLGVGVGGAGGGQQIISSSSSLRISL